jgi:hypothetical protein
MASLSNIYHIEIQFIEEWEQLETRRRRAPEQDLQTPKQIFLMSVDDDSKKTSIFSTIIPELSNVSSNSPAGGGGLLQGLYQIPSSSQPRQAAIAVTNVKEGK